ncbi:1-deoxy-D-xylulose-5-phosphate synthase [Ruminococcus flavefaciens]|uniref:1-deoxy-D-xylulose-5-phosphate synthase n=1 Tax=Ruminococcus flavefaciens TaxID=1265 RepID=A0A315XU13_RUMFL|nr:1-deoxy-D-xylulose-5-phosphate synthase [Ruminococcus flavefaciens]PWJ10406.1 1-deoxy-D-xylulose-5-phosphate synthase [Ruminococcus flavefaciens]SSA51861.1 1-deoxy-D-xylulose-5-phosphate synthase [Ruminococcus flavefaciens]
MYLENINCPDDIKKLEVSQLQTLADETRAALINKISKAGGHQGPNLGVVELTVAFHYVFNSPKDKIVFDVSHQCYPHKILTGRKEAFLDEEHFHDVTGYTNPNESEHDMFIVGHTSTSVSLALGLAKGRDLNKRSENIIALIGDGSLSGGEALEALDYAGEYDKNLIIIVNDNDQSIAENHGGLYKTLKKLRESNGTAEDNIFRAMGLDYRYLDEGHDTAKLVELFESVKDIDHPVVLHIHTIKGKGLPYAEKDRESWHAGGPFHVEDGSPLYPYEGGENVVFDCLKELLDTNENAIVLNAATPMGLGFVQGIREEYVQRGQFIDVGIAEENAVAMAGGIARNGGTAVFGTFAPFFQRTYDQMSHDVCLNDSPATFLILSPGAYGMNSNTHIALCDIQMFAHIPNLVYLAPASNEEFVQMFRYATTQKQHPVAIRVVDNLISTGVADDTDYSVLKNKVERKGSKAALIAVGGLVSMALKAADKVKEQTGTDITVINPRFVSGVDEELLDSLKKDHSLVITIEDGEVMGGYGQNIAAFYGDCDMRVHCHGISKAFHTEFKAEELLDAHGISAEKLTAEIIDALK